MSDKAALRVFWEGGMSGRDKVGSFCFLFVCFFKTTPTTSASPTPSPKQKMHVSILDMDTQKTLTRLVPRQQPRTSCGGKTEWLVRDYAQINRSTVTLHHIWAVCEPKSGRCMVICETCSMCRTRPQNRPCDRGSRLCHQAVLGVYFLWIHLAI